MGRRSRRPETIERRHTETGRTSLEVAVDPRVELLCVIFRLAGTEEYASRRASPYERQVHGYFGRYQHHAAVSMARELSAASGIRFAAPMSLAVHLTPVPRLRLRRPLTPWPSSLDARWQIDQLPEFLRQLRRFAKAAEFSSFLALHGSLYEQAVERMKQVTQQWWHPEWFEDFFGATRSVRFRVVIGLLTGDASYGPRFDSSRGLEAYAVRAATETDSHGVPRFDADTVRVLVHELAHSFVNPIIYAHAEELREAAEPLFSVMTAEAARGSYGQWGEMVHESVIRASEVLYCEQYGLPAGDLIAHHEERGFPWVGGLADRLRQYQSDRRTYPDLESYLPQLARFLTDVVPRLGRELAR